MLDVNYVNLVFIMKFTIGRLVKREETSPGFKESYFIDSEDVTKYFIYKGTLEEIQQYTGFRMRLRDTTNTLEEAQRDLITIIYKN